MYTKKWYESKTIWFNVCMTILDIAGFIEPYGLINPQIFPIVHGVGNIIMRIWFTGQNIDKSFL